MSDYGAGSPIWASEGVVSSSMLRVSEDLGARLYAWQDYFDQHFHYESGWQSPGDADVYAREGEELRRLLAAEIGSSYHVELDLWPVTEG